MKPAARRLGHEDEERTAILIVRARLGVTCRVPDATWAKVSWRTDLDKSATEAVRHAASRDRVVALVQEWFDLIGAPDEAP